MQVNIQEFISQAGLQEPFYPGKRAVKPCPQPGEYKSHCVVYDWRNPNLIRIEIKAGLSGHDLPDKDLIRYPVCFQAATYMEIDVQTGEIRALNREGISNEDDEDETDGEGSKGKSGGGKRPSRKMKESENRLSFASAVEGAKPNSGILREIVIMGKKIAHEAFVNVVDKFFTQVEHAKISATDLMVAAGRLVTKFTPPAFMKPKGDEDKVYKYNREKNEVMFTGVMP
ncbi:MAG: hypothetical protein WC043_09125 [Pseudobdellovibrionaceae bacterium]